MSGLPPMAEYDFVGFPQGKKANLGRQDERNDASGCGQHFGGDTATEPICGEQQRREISPTASAQSTDRVNPVAPGWTKRLVMFSLIMYNIHNFLNAS